jgi:hypothetical protein
VGIADSEGEIEWADKNHQSTRRKRRDRDGRRKHPQVLVLPNFAMTNYASQGKTRDINVVDLNNCKDHFS